MKVLTFSNGKVVLQKNTNLDFRSQCHRWGNCFDLVTGNPFEFTERTATDKEIKSENIRVEQIEEEYSQICEKNSIINRGNERLAKATNHKQFLNAYKF